MPSTRLITIGQSAASFTAIDVIANFLYGQKIVGCGALTANTLSTIYSKIGGAVVMHNFCIYTVDGASRTMRVEVTVDGVVVYDFTSAAITGSSKGVCLAGNVSSVSSITIPPIVANNSLLIRCASSLTETDKFNAAYTLQEY